MKRATGCLLFALIVALPACSSSCFTCSPIIVPTCTPVVFPEIAFDAARPSFDVGLDAPDAVRLDAPRSCGDQGTVGATCDLGDSCEPAWECFAGGSTIASTRQRDGEPGRNVEYPAHSVCSALCDAEDEGACGACGRCARPSSIEATFCLQACEPWAPSRGGCGEGFACDRAQQACVPSCFVDPAGVDSCQFTNEVDETVPSGIVMIDEGPDHPFRCNSTTGLCESIGRPDATAGDDCIDRFDCEDGGECVRSDPSDPVTTLSDGYCVRRGCDEMDLACRSDDVCAHTVFEGAGGVCMAGCRVGEEATDAERLGSAGGHPGCGTNEACFWDGVHGETDRLDGACWPGNYNDEPTYDVGSSCSVDADCFSPFGLGRCLFGDAFSDVPTARGMCVVTGCALSSDGLAGLRTGASVVSVPSPADVCRTTAVGGRDACLAFTSSQTFCIAGCVDPSECPEGYACTNLGDGRHCWPACTANEDCRSGRCTNRAGEACNASVDLCSCSDLSIRPDDAGTVEDDAGVDAATEDAAADAFDDAAIETLDAASDEDAGIDAR